MKRIVILIITHLLVLAAGYALHSMISFPEEEKSTVAADDTPVPERSRPISPAGESWYSAGDYRRAWNSLPHSDLPSSELAMLRERLLREWFSVDPRSALIAWSDTGEPDFQRLRIPDLGEHAEDVVGWIVAGDFGLRGKQILDAIAGRLSGMPPERALAVIALAPTNQQEALLRRALTSPIRIPIQSEPTQDSGDADQLAAIRGLEDEHLQSLAWQALLRNVAARNPERFHELLETDDLPPAPRLGALEDFARLLINPPSGKPPITDFLKLSSADQIAAAPALLSEAEKLSFARPTAVPDSLDLLMEGDHWDLVSSRGVAAIEHHVKSAKPNPEALARWALRLPAREEAQPVFRAAIAPRLRADPAATREWAESLPDGWHRAQALEAVTDL